MPSVIEFIGRTDPIRWTLVIVRGLFLQDMPLAVTLHNAWPLVAIAITAFVVTGMAVRRAVG